MCSSGFRCSGSFVPWNAASAARDERTCCARFLVQCTAIRITLISHCSNHDCSSSPLLFFVGCAQQMSGYGNDANFNHVSFVCYIVFPFGRCYFDSSVPWLLLNSGGHFFPAQSLSFCLLSFAKALKVYCTLWAGLTTMTTATNKFVSDLHFTTHEILSDFRFSLSSALSPFLLFFTHIFALIFYFVQSERIKFVHVYLFRVSLFLQFARFKRFANKNKEKESM